MRSPVLITPPAVLPVTLDEAKEHLRVAIYDEDGAVFAGDDDTLIEAFIGGAVSHLDGWTGILGRCLVEQTWRMDFDAFCSELVLPLGPVIEIVTVTWRNEDGQMATIDSDEYLLKTDAGGRAHVRFRNGYTFPSGLYESDPVSVTFKAGYPTIPAVEADPEADPPVEAVPAASTVPSAIKVAILLLVAEWFNNREATIPGSISELPFAVNALLAPFRRIKI
jgi:uncharacterized phiE125 gp8 family phage protein